MCCQVEVSATGQSLVQRSLTECGVSECDREATTMRRPWPTRGCHVMKKEMTGYHEETWSNSPDNIILCIVYDIYRKVGFVSRRTNSPYLTPKQTKKPLASGRTVTSLDYVIRNDSPGLLVARVTSTSNYWRLQSGLSKLLAPSVRTVQTIGTFCQDCPNYWRLQSGLSKLAPSVRTVQTIGAFSQDCPNYWRLQSELSKLLAPSVRTVQTIGAFSQDSVSV